MRAKKTTLKHRMHVEDDTFVDFVSSLLTYDQMGRPSAVEALKVTTILHTRPYYPHPSNSTKYAPAPTYASLYAGTASCIVLALARIACPLAHPSPITDLDLDLQHPWLADNNCDVEQFERGLQGQPPKPRDGPKDQVRSVKSPTGRRSVTAAALPPATPQPHPPARPPAGSPRSPNYPSHPTVE